MPMAKPDDGVLPKFEIRPPSTLKDDGKISASLSKDVQRIFQFIDDERHLTAHTLLHSIYDRINSWESKYDIKIDAAHHHQHHHQHTNNATTKNGVNNKNNINGDNAVKNKATLFLSNLTNQKNTINNGHTNHNNAMIFKKLSKLEKVKYTNEMNEIISVKQILQKKDDIIVTLENRVRYFRRAQANLKENDDWIFASNHFGVMTHYRREDDNSFSVKLEGSIEGVPLFEQLCILREIDLHYKWSPGCTSSVKIADLDKLDRIGWGIVGLPSFGLARDICYRVIGCDNTMEDGTIILAGQGIFDRAAHHAPPKDTYLSDDPILAKLDIPPAPTRMGMGRATISKLEVMVKVTSPTTVETKIVANVDPNLSIVPPILIEFFMKHLAGVALNKLQHAAKKIIRNPVRNEHAKMMRNEEKEFYYNWLKPKFAAVCERNGWTMPTIAAFNISNAHKTQEQQLHDKLVSATKVRADSASSNDDNSILENFTDMSQAGIDDARRQIQNQYVNNPACDLISELSCRFDDGGSEVRSVWSARNNPITLYLQERQSMIEKRKEAEIAAGRRRTAEQLKPKKLSFEDSKRLDELKRAKCVRLGLPYENNMDKRSLSSIALLEGDEFDSRDGSDTVATNTGRCVHKLTLSQRYTSALLEHSARTRFIVVSFLVAVLFVLLHGDVWLPNISSFAAASFNSRQQLLHSADEGNQAQSSFIVRVLQDLFVCSYIFLLCCIPHYLLCNTVLAYAFNSFEIGSKSGDYVKKYYIDNVRFVLAIISIGIATISIGKSLLIASWIALRIKLILWFDMTQQKMHNIIYNNMPDSVILWIERAVAVMTKFVGLMIVACTKIVLTPVHLLHRLLIRSNVVGQFMERQVMLPINLARNFIEPTAASKAIGLGEVDKLIVLSSWRYEAFDAARSLYSYTAMFLLVIIAGFALFARLSNDKFSSDKARKQKLKFQVSSISLDDFQSDDGSNGIFENGGRTKSIEKINVAPVIISRPKQFPAIDRNSTKISLPATNNSSDYDSGEDLLQNGTRRRRPRLPFRFKKQQ